MTHYRIIEGKPSNILRHGGPRDHRKVALYVNGRLYEEFREDSQDFNYANGKYFDKAIKEFIAHLRSFWPGKLYITKNSELEQFPEIWIE